MHSCYKLQVQKCKCKFFWQTWIWSLSEKNVFYTCKCTTETCLLIEYQFEYTQRTLFSIACHFTRFGLVEISLMTNLSRFWEHHIYSLICSKSEHSYIGLRKTFLAIRILLAKNDRTAFMLKSCREHSPHWNIIICEKTLWCTSGSGSIMTLSDNCRAQLGLTASPVKHFG